MRGQNEKGAGTFLPRGASRWLAPLDSQSVSLHSDGDWPQRPVSRLLDTINELPT